MAVRTTQSDLAATGRVPGPGVGAVLPADLPRAQGRSGRPRGRGPRPSAAVPGAGRVPRLRARASGSRTASGAASPKPSAACSSPTTPADPRHEPRSVAGPGMRSSPRRRVTPSASSRLTIGTHVLPRRPEQVPDVGDGDSCRVRAARRCTRRRLCRARSPRTTTPSSSTSTPLADQRPDQAPASAPTIGRLPAARTAPRRARRAALRASGVSATTGRCVASRTNPALDDEVIGAVERGPQPARGPRAAPTPTWRARHRDRAGALVVGPNPFAGGASQRGQRARVDEPLAHAHGGARGDEVAGQRARLGRPGSRPRAERGHRQPGWVATSRGPSGRPRRAAASARAPLRARRRAPRRPPTVRPRPGSRSTSTVAGRERERFGRTAPVAKSPSASSTRSRPRVLARPDVAPARVARGRNFSPGSGWTRTSTTSVASPLPRLARRRRRAGRRRCSTPARLSATRLPGPTASTLARAPSRCRGSVPGAPGRRLDLVVDRSAPPVSVPVTTSPRPWPRTRGRPTAGGGPRRGRRRCREHVVEAPPARRRAPGPTASRTPRSGAPRAPSCELLGRSRAGPARASRRRRGRPW